MVATTPPPTTTTTLDAETLLSTQCPVQFCLVYNSAPTASWSDGTPVTAMDFTRTIDAYSDLPAPAPSIGYDLVSNVDVIDQKRIRLGFSEGYGAWPGLFERLLAPGSEAGDPVGMPTTGPFHVTEWVRGDRIVVQRNDDWWSDVDPLSGEPIGTLQTVTFVFFDDLMAMIDALGAGEVDVIDARPDVEAVNRLSSLEGVEFTLSPGPFWEHIDFHHEDPLLAEDWARRALPLAIDREEILDRTVRLLDPAAEPLDNTIFMTQDQDYQPHFDVSYDPRAAARIFAEHGCQRGDDDVPPAPVAVCRSGGPRPATTLHAGRPLR
jgi:peptide/nickel transport system substrate-binding protein